MIPPIFVDETSEKDEECNKNKLKVYSMHTSCDLTHLILEGSARFAVARLGTLVIAAQT